VVPQFGWVFNGLSYGAPSDGAAVLPGSSTAAVAGKICGGGASVTMTLSGNLALGATPAGPVLSVIYSEDTRSPDASIRTAWLAGALGSTSPTPGTGSLTITNVSPSFVSGTFSFVLVPASENPSTGTRSLAGSFTLPFGTHQVC